MASGRKNYFRHSFSAGKDDKIVSLISDHGKSAYFHYFRLLELCGEQCSDGIPEKFVFHRRTLCAELMVTNSKLCHHLLAMQSSLLLEYVLSDRKVEVLIPNFMKFLGKYTNKIAPDTPNKRKEKEIKENKIKRKEKEEKDFSEAENILDYYLTKDLVGHKKSESFLIRVDKALGKRKEFNASEILKAIDNLNFIYNSKDFIWSVKWGLIELLTQDNALKFFPGEFDPERFPRSPKSRSESVQEKMLTMENPYAQN